MFGVKSVYLRVWSKGRAGKIQSIEHAYEKMNAENRRGETLLKCQVLAGICKKMKRI
jgi:hypothetical protein